MGKLSQLALLCATLQLTFMLASSTTSSHTSLTSYYKVKYFCWHKQQVWCRHPAYVQYKNDVCACVCKAGLTWDAKTKTCVCPYPGQYYNSYRKQCVCPSCQRWDSVTKTCICRIPGQVYEKRWRKCVCPKPLVLTKDSKRCACPYPGQVFDSKQKTCVCPGDLTLSSRKRCECPPCGPNERLVQQGNQCQCVCNVKCTGLFVLDRKSCKCVCREGLVFNSKTNQCVCPYKGQVYTPKGCVCPGDLELDTKTGTCVCPTCPDNFRSEQTGNQCECVCDRKCTGLFVLDAKACRCVCREGLVFNSKTNQCVCPYKGQVYTPKGCVCPGDLELDTKTGTCVCPTCPDNFRSEQTGNQCECVCDRKCTGLFVLDSKACRCVCREGLVFNSKTNQCVCPYKGQVYTPKGCVCPGDLELDTKTGTCVCPTCPDNFRSEQTGNQCECVCDRKCTGLFILDSKACRCVCREGLVLNSKTNQCVCPYKGQVYTPKGCVCPGDLELDTKTGTCVCPTCPDNFRSEQTGNQCECVCDRKCTGLFVLDSKACQCVCREGLVLNSKTNQCVCPYKGQVYTPKGCVCPGDLELDTKTGTCVCPTCPDNFRSEQTGNQCECVCDRKCTGLFVLDSKACQCVCREGLVLNSKTNQCVCPYKGQVYTPKGCVCPGDLELDTKTGTCVCPTCPDNFRSEQTGNQCECVCDRKCTGLFILDSKACQCVCREGLVFNEKTNECECPEGQTPDAKTYMCVCPLKYQVYTAKDGCVCPEGLILHPKTRSCVCPTCPRNFRWEQKGTQCNCICDIKCHGLAVLDRTTCQCQCPEGLVLDPSGRTCVCPKGLVLDQSTRTCLCPNRDQVYTPGKGCVCPGDLVLNSKTGSCECPTCPKGYTVTQSGDQCDCQCNIKCESPFVRSDSSCECVCPKGTTLANGKCVCPEGQHYNSYYKQCRCSGDKVLNSDTGRCECSACPHAGYTSIEKETTCKCVCTAICGEGRVLNQEECRCEEVATPPPMCRCKSKSPHPLHSIGCSRLSQKDCQAHASYQCTYVCQ